MFINWKKMNSQFTAAFSQKPYYKSLDKTLFISRKRRNTSLRITDFRPLPYVQIWCLHNIRRSDIHEEYDFTA